MAADPLRNVRITYTGIFSRHHSSAETVEAALLWLRQRGKLEGAELHFRMDGPEYVILSVNEAEKTCLVEHVNLRAQLTVSFKQIKEGRFNAI